MDLKQPISLGKSKKIVYPSKTTINLMSAEQTRANRGTQLILFAILLVLIGIFAKFAVLDPLASAMNSNADIGEARAQLTALQQENANYAQLNEKYARYVVTGLTEEEQNLTDRDTVLNLLEEKVMGVGYISSIKVMSNVATVAYLGVDLPTVSKLVESLESDERVSHVTVSTAQSEDKAAASATLKITFKGAMGDVAEASGASAASGTGVSK